MYRHQNDKRQAKNKARQFKTQYIYLTLY